MILVGVAGGSGSGKTTFAKKILKGIPSHQAGILHQDSYYLSSPSVNFDHPDAFDWELFEEHLNLLKSGHQINVPEYDFKSNARSENVQTLGPCQAVVVEGIFTLWKPEIRQIFDLKIYLHVDADIRFIRRLHRDIKERGRTLDGVIRQYYDSVRPMHHRFLEPTQQYADIVVGEETDVAAGVVAAKIRSAIS